MVRRKGELTAARIDRDWPHQVAVELRDGDSFDSIRPVGDLSSLCLRGHSVNDGERTYRVFCFADAGQAERFRLFMGGERFDPRDRGRGRHWMQWRRPRA